MKYNSKIVLVVLLFPPIGIMLQVTSVNYKTYV